MVMRNFIEIDEDRCNGCGNCIVACAEGALELVDGKAKVVKESYCDGLGACIGDCPVDALKIVQKDVDEFDEDAVEEHLKNIGRESLKHEPEPEKSSGCGGGCPGMAMRDMRDKADELEEESVTGDVPSQLKQWPVQLHLVSPQAPYFKGADLLIAADCTAFAYGNFHKEYLKGKALVIACPKLDRTEGYIEKLAEIIKGGVNSVTVLRMQVPCCGGLSYIVQEAMKLAGKKVPYLEEIVSIEGEIL